MEEKRYIKLHIVSYAEADEGPDNTKLALVNGELCYEIGFNRAATWLKLDHKVILEGK